MDSNESSSKFSSKNLPFKGTEDCDLPADPPANMPIKDSMSEMPVSKALWAYEQLGDTVDGGYDSLIKQYGDKKLSEGIPNSDYFHALCLTSIMFRRTKSQIRILSGFDLDPFIGALHRTFEGALERIKKVKEGFVRILLIEDISQMPLTYLRQIQSKYSDIVGIKKLIHGSIKPSHRTICDDDKLRLEKPHPPLTEKSKATLVQATAYFGNTARARAEAEYFDWMWNSMSY